MAAAAMGPWVRSACGRRSLVVATLVLAVASPAARAEADGPDHYRIRGVAAGSFVNLRAEPSPAAARLARIPAAARCLRNLGCRGGLSFEEFTTLTAAERRERERANPRWCNVEYRGTAGWVAGRYVAEDGGCPPVAAAGAGR